ncbi:LIMLP_16695 family PerRB-regulated protein [Leptospira fletcheri]|uniref:LIMLP_16695 family PerRB-regulated protein n=1 Tax=Leptospira fletcheri TaxID=2484981 RepID=UPI0014383798|nr:hypothetical protein [Leptospira fletcheri]
MSRFKSIFDRARRTSYLKESWKEEEWYATLADRPGIETKIPFFKKEEENRIQVAVLSR